MVPGAVAPCDRTPVEKLIIRPDNASTHTAETQGVGVELFFVMFILNRMQAVCSPDFLAGPLKLRSDKNKSTQVLNSYCFCATTRPWSA